MRESADRRRYARTSTRLAAVIRLADGSAVGCMVRDYCLGGMLIELGTDAAGGTADFGRGQAAHIEADVTTPSGTHRLDVNAQVVWSRGDHLGISFQKGSATIVKLLHEHIDPDPAVAAASRTPIKAGGAVSASSALNRLIELGRQLTPSLLNDFVGRFADSLREHVIDTTSDTERHQVYADISALDVLRRQHGLVDALIRHASELDVPEITKPGTDEEGLSLVDQEEFERWLEAARMATLLNDEFSEELRELRSRMATLRKLEDPSGTAVPFEPQHFAITLNEFANNYEFGATSRHVMFDIAADVLLQRLGGIYHELDAALDELGTPEATTPKAKKNASKEKPQEAATDASARPSRTIKTRHVADSSARGKGHGKGAGSEKVAAQTGTADSSGVAAEGGRSGADEAFDITHIELDSLPSIDLDEDPERAEHDSFEISLATVDPERETHATQMVMQLNELAKQDDQFAVWLDLLAEPLKQAAIRDRGFFGNPAHPVREILDALGQLQLLKPANPTSSDAMLDLRILDMLTALKPGETSPELLATTARIRQLANVKSLRFQRNTERSVEAAIGRDRQRQTRSTVIAELNRRYANRLVPVQLLLLLRAGWYAALKMPLLDDIADHARYEQNFRLLDIVAGRLGAELDAFEDDLGLTDQMLVDRIRRELARVSFNPLSCGEIETALRRQLSIQPQSPAKLIPMKPLSGRKSPVDHDSPPEDIPPAEWQELEARCDAIAVGDALRFKRGTGVPIQLQVAWIRPDRKRFILVDEQGVQQGKISRRDLAVGFYRQQAEQITNDGRPLSERIVDSLLEGMQGKLATDAENDPLTGLLTRRHFRDAMGSRLDGQTHGALLCIDIDQFRLVNDIYGYDQGDRLIVALARLLEDIEGDVIVGYQGADRFLMLLTGVESDLAVERCRELCDRIRQMEFEVDGQRLNLSASAGLVGLPTQHDAPDALLRAAENALSSAKLAGGDTVYVYRDDDPGMVSRRESLQWVAQVDQALDRGELHLRCQLIAPTDAGSANMPHYEVLLGVANGASRTLPIEQFIGAAERYNRMRAVDRWVTRTVVDWIAAHREHMPMLHGFAVNPSGQTASDAQFVPFVRELFAKTEINPGWVSFEVTETAAVNDLNSSAHIVAELKALGCKVALDDFGSGQASYSYLKELPVDWLKIDGAFVRKIAADQNDLAVVRSINEIGHFMGKQTIAEYVADAETLRLVREIGVDYAQGYEIAAPCLLEELLQQPQAGND
jgi:diguanylate cyclase (GGDEF)-like protein